MTNAIELRYYGNVHAGSNHRLQLSAASSSSWVFFCGFSENLVASFTIRLTVELLRQIEIGNM